MKRFLIFAMLPLAAHAGEKKPLPGQAGNDDIELVGKVLIDRDEIKEALGADLGEGYVVVRMKAEPKTEKPLRIGPDDFTLISRKDGQRSAALAPGQIAGKGTLVIKAGPEGAERKTSWEIGGMGSGIGTAPAHDTIKETKVDNEAKENPILGALKEKGLPDKESTTALEGLLYFPIDGKIKPKDLALIYKGPAGKLIMEFAPLKLKK